MTRVWQGPVPQVSQVCVTILEAELWELLGCAPGRTSGQWYPWCSSLVTKSDESLQGVWCQDPAWLSWVTQTQYTVQPSTVHSTGILVSSEAAAQLMTRAWEISRVVLIIRWKLSPSSSPNEHKMKAHVKQFYYSPFRVCCFELSALDHFACLKRSLWHN